MVTFAAGYFRSAKTTAAGYLYALGAGLGGPHHALLHGAAEGDTLFELGRDVLGYELSVGIGAVILDKVN